MQDEDVPVSDTDELSTEGGRDVDRARRLGEFRPTNAPLSAAEIRERKTLPGKKPRRGRRWTPRTLENIHEIEPPKKGDPPA
jgi:hypothetical protein